MNRIYISLRDLTGRPGTTIRKLVTTSAKHEEYLPHNGTKTAEAFVKKVRQKFSDPALLPERFDIYISLYIMQGDVILPLSFYVLVAKLKAKVTIDFNS